jgi:hypothetical protein
MTRSRRTSSLILCLALSFSSVSWGWGKTAHEVIEVAAAQMMPPSPLARLLQNNLTSLQQMATVPDFYWKHGPVPHPLEAQAHFFQYDFFFPNGEMAPTTDIATYLSQYGQQALLKNGTATWRMEEMAQELVRVLQRPQVSSAEVIQIAGTMGHYVGDLSQPLHCAIDYDGKIAGVPGIHAYFETKTVSDQFTPDELTNLVTDAATPLLNTMTDVSPIDAAFTLARGASADAPGLLKMGVRLKLTKEFQVKAKPLIVKSMSRSVAVLAKIWHQAWVMAGKPQFDTSDVGQVSNPDWVPVSYIGQVHGLIPSIDEDDDTQP